MTDKETDRIDKSDKAIDAYDRVMVRLLKTLSAAEASSWVYVQKKVEEAVELELTAEEMTRDEMNLITAYIKRDMKQLGFYAHETGEGIAAWLHFDLNVLEEKLKQLLVDLADRTRIQQEELRERLSQGDDQYTAGEVATAGTFECVACQAQEVLTKTNKLSPCRACGGRYFHRISQPWRQGDH
ncbi:MAG: zinc ribbon-containing protein [Pontibacterium sp.]